MGYADFVVIEGVQQMEPGFLFILWERWKRDINGLLLFFQKDNTLVLLS
jgi:hypothetical protein